MNTRSLKETKNLHLSFHLCLDEYPAMFSDVAKHCSISSWKNFIITTAFYWCCEHSAAGGMPRHGLIVFGFRRKTSFPSVLRKFLLGTGVSLDFACEYLMCGRNTELFPLWISCSPIFCPVCTTREPPAWSSTLFLESDDFFFLFLLSVLKSRTSDFMTLLDRDIHSLEIQRHGHSSLKTQPHHMNRYN